MNKYFKIVDDILKKKIITKVIVKVEKSDIKKLTELVNFYKNGNYENSPGWKNNCDSVEDLESITYLIFYLENNKATMYRQSSEYIQDKDYNELIFEKGKFFVEAKGVKKKLEL